jgi:hypothetical protein
MIVLILGSGGEAAAMDFERLILAEGRFDGGLPSPFLGHLSTAQ